ncbi:hypothetical protein E5347_09980 [Clostridium sartagoforme]|uniref:SpaA-like prealbumin fold domain-containing protein n=1 Tax=Clostridium sartagoforme TaxID=84031 RepID=A0A4S2DJI4_9CLOT|nr:SpaA isopeptide-forming pilin-related protein [Clostridium sartagoforme]TGY42055.1 hypothetical protein E5347_09980 [Clostridium sartagoforme]
MKFKKAIALTVSALLTFMNMSNIVMAEEQQPITDGKQKINANKLDWTPVSRANQLGGADDFSGIFFNEFKNFNETGGPIAAGSLKNVNIVTFNEGLRGGINQFNDIVIPKFNVGVMAQKEINIQGKTLISNGDAVIGDSVDPQKLDPKVGNIYKRQSEIDKFLGDAKADLVKLNKDLWNTKETAKAIYDGNTVILNCVDGINIFEVDLTSGRKNIKFNYAEDAKDSTIIIKYKGNVINYGETFIGDTMLDKINVDGISNRVIWTFDPSLKEVKIERTIVFGSILAPNADITFSSAGYSAINGTIIANGLDGSGSSSEIHWVGPFKGDILTPIEKTGSFKFNKIDNYDKAVNGATFALYQDGLEKYTATSTGTGVVSFSGIKEGNYILKETTAPDGYEISTDEIIVIVDKDGKVTFKVDGKEEVLENLNGIFVNNISKTEFSFRKVVSGTDTVIPNVEFKLMQGEKVVATVTSDENGEVSFENIELGTYTLIEARPFGYEAAGPWTVNVTKEGAFIDDEKLIQIENVEVIGGFEFNKLDNHEKAVKGAKFALYQEEKVKYDSTSSEEGLVSFNDIKQGTYTLKETEAPDGYEISTDEIIVIVDKDGKVTFKVDGKEEALENLNGIFVNNISKTEFSFNKVVSGTDTGIPNVEFKLMQGDKVIATDISNESGVVSFKNVELGTYTLVETRPFGYEAAGPWTVNVTKEGAFIGETKLDKIENVKVTGGFEFNKLDNHEKAVKGAKFALYQDEEVKYTSTSSEEGLVSFNNVKEGIYILKETNTPEGYEISNSVVEVTVDSNGTVTFKVNGEGKELGDLDNLYVNKITTVEFTFNKVISGTKTGIPGVEFKLIQGDNIVATVVSDANGTVRFSNIEIGSYRLVETTPYGYKAAGPWDIEVTKNGVIFEGKALTQIENAQVIGSFNFNKLDNHNNPVKGAEFALYQDGKVKYTSISTGNLSLESILLSYKLILRSSDEISIGEVSFIGIKQGTYILRETKAPDGYEISNAVVEVTVNSDGIVTFKVGEEDKEIADLEGLYVNNISRVEFNFKKLISGTDTVIPGVEFKLIQGEKEIATAVSNENGVVSFENIELGTYTLIETTPTGYKEAGPWTVNVTKEGAFIDESKLEKIENEKIIEKTGLFQFNKNDNYGNPVNGAGFALYQDEEIKYTVTSTDTGLVSFSGIKEGTYTLKEVSAPKGYEISKVEVEVTVNSDGTVTFKESGVIKTGEDLESLYINKMILGSISFTKYINDKKGILAGAEFELLINGERYGSTVFSDANGLVTFLNVKPGEYEIREVSSHSKYFKTSDKTAYIVIDENGVSSIVGKDKMEAETLFINKVENSIEFIKYSDSNSVLSNATFELLKGTEVIATSISDKNGVVRFENILPGEYIVREKLAPKGYIKSEATRKLVVKDNGEISITASEIKEWEEAFKNKKVVEPKEEKPEKKEEITIPKTSDDANVIFPIITAIISLAGIVFIKRIKH